MTLFYIFGTLEIFPKFQTIIAICRRIWHSGDNVSDLQFLRRFKQAFACSPQMFILKTRISAACYRLSKADDKLTQIARDCGFADSSSFVQLFRREMGETPLSYRRRYRL